MSYPLRGEVWMIDLGMAAKVRPCVIVSAPIGDTDRAVITIVPHTTSTRRTSFETAIEVSYLKPGAFDAQRYRHSARHQSVPLLGKDDRLTDAGR